MSFDDVGDVGGQLPGFPFCEKSLLPRTWEGLVASVSVQHLIWARQDCLTVLLDGDDSSVRSSKVAEQHISADTYLLKWPILPLTRT